MVATRNGSKRLASRARVSDLAGPAAKRIRTKAKSTPAQVATPALPENDTVVEQTAEYRGEGGGSWCYMRAGGHHQT